MTTGLAPLFRNVMIDGGCPVQLSEYIPRHRDTSEWKGVPKGIIDELPGDVVHDDPWPDTPSLALEVLMEKSCQHLAKPILTSDQVFCLIEEIFSGPDGSNAIRCLHGDNAQIFIDIAYEALGFIAFSPRTQKKCLKALYKTCARNVLLPTRLQVPLCYDRTGDPLYAGAFGEVWKGQLDGQDVAVKVMKKSSGGDAQKVIRMFCKEVVTWKALWHPNVLPLIGATMIGTQLVMVSEWMPNGNINEFVKAHPDANRLELLKDVTRGLIYVHGLGMIHGDLKGANILVDRTGHACLADFGLLTVISDPTTGSLSSSSAHGGTVRWMSPELLNPQQFGFKKIHPTESSDCYALGMVIYETISGCLPFHRHRGIAVALKVLEGERPPRETWFTDSLWGMLEMCWESQPAIRPSIEEVLRRLEMESPPPVESPSPSPGTSVLGWARGLLGFKTRGVASGVKGRVNS